MSGCTHICDIDEMAVDLAIEGHQVKLNQCERVAAVRRMRRLNYSLSRMAGVLRITQRSVERIVARVAAGQIDE